MRFSDFIHQLDAETQPGHHGICFAIPNMPLPVLRDIAGSEGEIVAHPGYVTITFAMEDGHAVVTGFLKDDRLETGWVFFAPHP
jgi:hypothetical protein